MNNWHEVADGHWQCAKWDVLWVGERGAWTVAHARIDRVWDETFATPREAMEFCDRIAG
jgi:hypothetical protein